MLDYFIHLSYCALTIASSFQHETTEPHAISRSGKLINYWPPRRVPYIGYKAPSISSVT
jgi:hypothetical protein